MSLDKKRLHFSGESITRKHISELFRLLDDESTIWSEYMLVRCDIVEEELSLLDKKSRKKIHESRIDFREFFPSDFLLGFRHLETLEGRECFRDFIHSSNGVRK